MNGAVQLQPRLIQRKLTISAAVGDAGGALSQHSMRSSTGKISPCTVSLQTNWHKRTAGGDAVRLFAVVAAAIMLAGCRVSASTELYVQDLREWAQSAEPRTLPIRIDVIVPAPLSRCANVVWPDVKPTVTRYFQRVRFLGCGEPSSPFGSTLKLEAEVVLVTRSTESVPGLTAMSLSSTSITDQVDGEDPRNGIQINWHINPTAAKQLSSDLSEVISAAELDLSQMRTIVVINNDAQGSVDAVMRGVFVDNDPTEALGEIRVIGRRSRSEIQLSDVQTALMLKKGSAVATIILDGWAAMPTVQP